MSNDVACLLSIARIHQWLPASLNNTTLEMRQHNDVFYLVYEWLPGSKTPRGNKTLAGWEEMNGEVDLPPLLRDAPFLIDALGNLAHFGRWAAPLIFAKANNKRQRWKIESQVIKVYGHLTAHPWMTCRGLPLMTWPAWTRPEDLCAWSDQGGNLQNSRRYEKDNPHGWQVTALLCTEGRQDLNFLAIQAAKAHLNFKDNTRLRMTCHLAISLQRDVFVIGKWEEAALTHILCKTLTGLLSCSHRIWDILHSHIQPYPAGKVKGLRCTFITCKAWWNYAQTWEIRIRGLPELYRVGARSTWRVLRAMGHDLIARSAIARTYEERILGERFWMMYAQVLTRQDRRLAREVRRALEQDRMDEVD
jgi:hypothetical protein